MKQINDIPVRRRPQSKDVHPENGQAERPRRQIWDLDFDGGQKVEPQGPVSELPEPKPARPRSKPLILTPSSRQVKTEDTVAAPTPAEPDDAPVTAAGSTPPASPIKPADVPQKKAVSRPRVAEPSVEDAHDDAARKLAQASSLRQRSRPIMAPAEPAQAPTPPASQGARVNRAKTRILGFHAPDVAPDPLAGDAKPAAQNGGNAGQFPAGWFVIIAGPGRGASFTIATGVSTIGRGEDQSIALDFGDQSVSRSAHASVAYDEEQNKFFIGHGGKSNVVRRNGAPVLATEEMQHGDTIRIGKTTLKFVAFCGSEFTWVENGGTGPEVEHG